MPTFFVFRVEKKNPKPNKRKLSARARVSRLHPSLSLEVQTPRETAGKTATEPHLIRFFRCGEWLLTSFLPHFFIFFMPGSLCLSRDSNDIQLRDLPPHALSLFAFHCFTVTRACVRDMAILLHGSQRPSVYIRVFFSPPIFSRVCMFEK